MSPVSGHFILLCLASCSFTSAWTPIIVKNVTALGPQLTPDVPHISRDGGYSVLLNGNSVWLYDDTECTDSMDNQLSFVSNTAAYQNNTKDVSTVTDFGIVNLGTDKDGKPKVGILADTTVGTGGWIPFSHDELDFNKQTIGKERVAIWPGTSPTSVSTIAAFLYAPLVYVDYKPQDPSKEYQARGMTLVAIYAPESGPLAARQGDLVIPGTEVAFGGFSSLMGFKSTDAGNDKGTDKDEGLRDVYVIGVTDAGLQLARADINDLSDFSKYSFWNPQNQQFSAIAPRPTVNNTSEIYIPGSFTSGSIFYSPYFATFIMVYFNKMVDSTFYIRYLQLHEPLAGDKTWLLGGKNGKGIIAEDVEALVRYQWSAEQKLYQSPTGLGGFNYAGNAHPEYFNTQYFAKSLYRKGTPPSKQYNEWYGSSLILQKDGGGDGKNLLLSWTSQLKGGMNHGIYQIQLAVLSFDDIPPNPDAATPSPATSTKPGHIPVSSVFATVEKGTAIRVLGLGYKYLWSAFFVYTSVWFFVKMGGPLI